METRRLEYFVQIADAGSINRAAAILGLAQPALSQQLAVLERELKVQLLERSPTGVTLTDAGRRLYARAQIILRQVGRLRADLAEAAVEVSGLVTVGLPPSLGLCIGLPLLEAALRDHPKLRLQIVEDGTTSLTQQLQRGLVDMAILPVRTWDPEIESEPLLQEALKLITASAWPPAPTDTAGLAALPWIVTGSPNAIRAHLNTLFALADQEPNIVAEINSLPLVIRAVERGLGVTLLPLAAVADALAKGSVRASAFGEAQRSVYLCARRDHAPSAATAAVRALIIVQAGRLSDSAQPGT